MWVYRDLQGVYTVGFYSEEGSCSWEPVSNHEDAKTARQEVNSLNSKELEKVSMWTYVEDFPFTVGFYKPDGSWEPESDHDSRQEAQERANYLNGITTKLSEEQVKELHHSLEYRGEYKIQIDDVVFEVKNLNYGREFYNDAGYAVCVVDPNENYQSDWHLCCVVETVEKYITDRI